VTPQKFNKHTEGLITSTSSIAELIGQLFGSVFNDYSGCNVYLYNGSYPIIPNNLKFSMLPGNLYVDLFFEKNNSQAGGIDNVELINENSKSELMPRLTRVCGGGSVRTYNLNKETKDCLLEFVPGYNPDNNKFNPCWNERIFEQNVNVNVYNNITKSVLKVIALDVDAIIGKIYGTRQDDEGPLKYDYHCIPIARSAKGMVMYYNNLNATAAPTMVDNAEYAIQILRNDRSIVNAMMEAIGLPQQAVGPMNYTRYNRG